MGSPSVVFIITIFLYVSLQCTHILIAGGSWEVQKPNFKEERGVRVVNEKKDQVEKVSGKDDNEDSETLLFQKVRALLGLRSSKAGSSLTRNLSPSPSPSPLTQPEAPTPSPPPMPPVHKHDHSPLHHSKPKSPPLDKGAKQHTDNGRNKRVLVAVLFSSGAALIVCLLGLIWVVRGKIRRHKKASFKTTSAHRKKARSRGKVSLNPGLDFLYLDALGRDMEQQTIGLKQTSQTSNTIYEREESNQELIIKPEVCDNNTSGGTSTREIMSVHEQVELDSVKGESVGGNASNGDKTIPTEDHCSDDESFHSFVDDPHSSSTRHSNASAASLSEASENSPPEISTSPPSDPIQLPKFNVSSPSDSRKTSTPPPPPPPPPPIPAPSTHLLPLKTSSKPTKPLSKSPGSFTSLNLPKRDFSPSPRNSPKLSGALPPIVPLPPLAPPPPFLKGDATSSSIKGPPPPSSSQFRLPVGKDGAPLPKLKPLHWDKVRAAPDRNMVWDKIRSSSFEIDEEMMESLFGYNLHSPMKNEESKCKSPSPGKHVLDPKRLQNMTILSKAVNSTAEQVCDALMRGDGLSQQQLEALAKMAPTKEEEVKLSGCKGNIDELGSAEKFVKVVLSVPFSFLRVEAMLYRENFEDEVVHLRNSFSMLEEACKELRSSKLFLKLLEAVLKTGNRMNVGTIRGGAKAFKLDALLKLADVKGTDGKTTLLHFVVQEIIRSEGIRVSDSIMGKINQKNNNRKTPEEKEEDYKRMGLDLVSGLSTELYNVKKTATVDLELLAGSVSNLSDGMTKLKELVNELANNEEQNGRFVGSMKGFIAHAERALKELREDEERVFLRVREVTEYFHGVNVNKDEANPLRIFVIVRDFLCMLDHVCKELRRFKVPSSPNPLAPFR